jgi:hypothetical protein
VWLLGYAAYPLKAEFGRWVGFRLRLVRRSPTPQRLGRGDNYTGQTGAAMRGDDVMVSTRTVLGNILVSLAGYFARAGHINLRC